MSAIRARLAEVRLGATLRISFCIADVDAFRFDAGQYTAIQLDNEHALTLSIASAPSRLPMVRTLFRPTPGDPSSDALLERLKSARTLSLAPPAGDVRWPMPDEATQPSTDRDAPALLVGAGTGAAQVFAVLEMALDCCPDRLGRFDALLLAADDASQLEHEDEAAWMAAGAKITRVCDSATDDTNAGFQWLRDRADQWCGHPNLRVLLGGSPPFVYAAHDVLVSHGVRPDALESDVYAYAPRA
ncbi:MAG: hypothetical protein AAF648_13600 [Pseudomonadota bacterium]